MARHDYSPEQALDTIIRKVRDASPDLANQIEEAIDAGKDIVQLEQVAQFDHRKRKPRQYRKTAPLSHEEALQVALDVLQSHFVEQPLFVKSLGDSLQVAATGSKKPWLDAPEFGVSLAKDVTEGVGDRKSVAIERQSETRLIKERDERFDLFERQSDEIEDQKRNIISLRELLKFS